MFLLIFCPLYNPINGQEKPILSSYLWESPQNLTKKQKTDLINKTKNEGVKKLYISVDNYADFENTKSTKQKNSISDINKSIYDFVKLAKENGIEVEGLAGDPNWALTDYQHTPIFIMNMVLSYNQQYPKYPLKGIQYDIEYYNLPNFSSNKNNITKSFLELVKKLQTITKDNNFRIGFAIPFWFGYEDTPVPNIDYNSKKQPIGFHLLDILSDTNSYIVIMAYRDKTDGLNGSINISKNLVQYGLTKTPLVEILIGQETGKTEEKNISFYGMSKDYFKQSITNIYNAFQKSPNVKGIAIHYIYSYLDLK